MHREHYKGLNAGRCSERGGSLLDSGSEDCTDAQDQSFAEGLEDLELDEMLRTMEDSKAVLKV